MPAGRGNLQAGGIKSGKLNMQKKFFVYILTNATHTVLYTGVTNDLTRRMHEHREGTNKGFTRRYHVNQLVYYEVFDDPIAAIQREKQIKAGSKGKKLDLIKKANPERRDLYEEIIA
jgi:putative endonuclease